MARPRKTGLDYFPHDVDASEDEKIEALRALYGNDGYAFYFILLERIYRSDNAELDISKKAILAALVKKIGISEQKFFEMLNTAFDIELFNKQLYEQNNVITSKGIKKRFEEVESMRERWRKKKKSKEENKEENKEDTSNIFSGENSEETGESKVKESKEKKSKVNKINYAEYVSMTNDEYQKLLAAYGEEATKKMIEILDNYKGSTGKKYKSDYRTILNWVVQRYLEEKNKQGGNVCGNTGKHTGDNKPNTRKYTFDKSKFLYNGEATGI
jgi:hypothetical protein